MDINYFKARFIHQVFCLLLSPQEACLMFKVLTIFQVIDKI